jgi:hypothetical protein
VNEKYAHKHVSDHFGFNDPLYSPEQRSFAGSLAACITLRRFSAEALSNEARPRPAEAASRSAVTTAQRIKFQKAKRGFAGSATYLPSPGKRNRDESTTVSQQRRKPQVGDGEWRKVPSSVSGRSEKPATV